MTPGPATAPSFRHTVIPGVGNRVRVVITVDPPLRPAQAATQLARRPRPGPGRRTDCTPTSTAPEHLQDRRPKPGPGATAGQRRPVQSVHAVRDFRTVDPVPDPFTVPLRRTSPIESVALSRLTAPSPAARQSAREHARQLRRRWLVASVLLVLGVGVGVPLLFQALYALTRH